MQTETKSDSNLSKKNVYEEMINLKNDFAILMENINEETKIREMRKEENFGLLNLNCNEMCNGSIEENAMENKILIENSNENNTNDIFCNENEDKLNEKEKVLNNDINIKNITEDSDENIEDNIHNFNLIEINSSRSESKEGKSEDNKMKTKIQNLLKLINLLKLQINKKDQEIYNMEIDLKLKEKNDEKGFNIYDVEEDSNNLEKSDGENFLVNRMKSMLISQNEEITALNEELKKKSQEIFYLTQENTAKNEKLVELKKEIETNYMYLKEYRSFQKELEMDVNNKIYNAENYLNITNQKLKENNINIKEKNLNIEKQRRIIKELNNELKKKEEKICELRDMIENIELNNSRDIIKYKQNNMDLINRLSLNNSLMNNQKIEIENMHINYKQLEEELKNKDNELKKLHRNLLAKDEENNKTIHDMNRLKFDLEIKNINIVNIKKKVKNIKKECSIRLKKQKEHYIGVINQIYKEKDEIMKNHIDEISKLTNHYNEVVSANENIKNEMNDLNDEILKKCSEIEKLQDKLLDCESKLLIYENNNEIKILKKNEDHLRKLLNKHIHRNEQLLNTTFLLQKSTLENNSLEKKIIELKAKTYRKDREIKKLQETNNKRKSFSDCSSESDDKNNGIKDTRVSMTKNNIKDEENFKSLLRKTNDKNNLVVSSSEISNKITREKESLNSIKDDPIYLALYDYLNCYSRNNNAFKIKKVDTNTYLLNGKRIIIKFINGDLYVEDDIYPVKLQDYLLKNSIY
ncbi:conserved Plasmodium protein, unknown function [Plasmodium gallinaceum]|uniref:Uncharacterized protein n=1 Tax=Plasmodium gallinaceum TaxID=5849 RepID=A0A1J1GMU1_PLAGA|nr:conserved Plasmodium protein, unknown function [Plasmodium gallinaceum]CRG93581.1 conserved Plasmodium protein, unknown function [Plasmodium gallinaceum]